MENSRPSSPGSMNEKPVLRETGTFVKNPDGTITVTRHPGEGKKPKQDKKK
jgi:hypothetical protein